MKVLARVGCSVGACGVVLSQRQRVWCGRFSHLMGFAAAGQLHGGAGQEGGVAEGEEGGTRPPGEHVLPVRRGLVAPGPAPAQQEQEEAQERAAVGAWGRHGVSRKGAGKPELWRGDCSAEQDWGDQQVVLEPCDVISTLVDKGPCDVIRTLVVKGPCDVITTLVVKGPCDVIRTLVAMEPRDALRTLLWNLVMS